MILLTSITDAIIDEWAHERDKLNFLCFVVDVFSDFTARYLILRDSAFTDD